MSKISESKEKYNKEGPLPIEECLKDLLHIVEICRETRDVYAKEAMKSINSDRKERLYYSVNALTNYLSNVESDINLMCYGRSPSVIDDYESGNYKEKYPWNIKDQ